MGHIIHSTIEINTTGCEMDHKRKRHHRKKVKPHSHHYKSEAKSNKNRFFHNVKNVEVNIQEEDCLTGCFSALAKCFGRGSGGS